jgi:hypothetical protein
MDETRVKTIREIGLSRPTLAPNDMSKVLFKRAVAIADTIRESYSDCINGVWLYPSASNTCTAELLIDTTLNAGEMRRISLGEAISDIFDNERTVDDTYEVYYLDTAYYNEEVESNREKVLNKLKNSYVVYLVER